MNISMIPTIAAPARASDALPGAALPGFGDLLQGAAAGIVTMTTATAADARVALAQPQLAPGMAIAADAHDATAPATGDIASLPDAMGTAGQPEAAEMATQSELQIEAENDVADGASEHGGEQGSTLSRETEANAKPVSLEQRHALPAPEQQTATLPSQSAAAERLALAALPETAAPAFEDVAPEESEALAAPDNTNIDLPVPTLPEAARPAQSGSDAIMPISTPIVPSLSIAPDTTSNAAARDIALADNAAAQKAEPAATGGGAGTAAADTAKPMTGDGASEALPSQLFSQALATPAPRPAGQPYPAAASHMPHQPVVAAQPGQIGRDMGVEIARHVAAGKEEVLIRLDPAEMGRIDVRLSFDREGSLRAVMAADSPAALDMLRREAGDLSRALNDAGVRADPQSFRFDSRGGDAGQAWQRGQQGSDTRGGQGGATHNGGEGAADEPVYQSLRSSGRVDLMA
ncbi:flagellar hook-length control protein FliK [Sphingomonas cavernae]|uniref:Flagellar hook-length control protein FliK n=1 Tax=Sphingomonas cavernae TaxID=2320861 RepID=A0A418W6T3_9SPHN|nr:flagellar hook-length control protein FliK [Sphingomonas cavernae]RJF85753.1 flagellar hook-length control protein FliK [Sphingomonas cavernae]